MKIASWNINSVRLRLPLIKQLVEFYPLDILCLQETKTPDEFFPAEDLRAMGFPHLAFAGEKGYNGVAILSKLPLTEVTSQTFCDTGQKRHIQATLPDGTELHNFYIPSGGDEPDTAINPKFAHKLDFVDACAKWATKLDKKRPTIALGDFNIAPGENDVWSHKQMSKIISHTPVEIEKLTAFYKAGNWLDAHRHFTPEPQKLFSWWSYRARDWEGADRGLRLDHLWLSPALAPRLKAAETLKDPRRWQSPSDHIPVVAEITAPL